MESRANMSCLKRVNTASNESSGRGGDGGGVLMIMSGAQKGLGQIQTLPGFSVTTTPETH